MSLFYYFHTVFVLRGGFRIVRASLTAIRLARPGVIINFPSAGVEKPVRRARHIEFRCCRPEITIRI